MCLKIVIYKIENKINKKIYIGQTINFKQRKNYHKEEAFREKSKAYNRPLYKDIREFGIENFEITIIDTADTLEELNEKEKFWINKFDCYQRNNKGYNQIKGGLNKVSTKEVREKMSNAQKGPKNWNYGLTDEKSHNAKKIINITKNIIYGSAIDCAITEFGDKKFIKSISNVCNPNSNKFTFKGNVYAYLDKNGNPIVKKVKRLPYGNPNKPIKIINKIDGKIYNSIAELKEKSNGKLSSNMIRDRIYKRIKTDKLKDKYDLEIYNK